MLETESVMDVDEVCRKLWMVRRACDNVIVIKSLPLSQRKPYIEFSKCATQSIYYKDMKIAVL